MYNKNKVHLWNNENDKKKKDTEDKFHKLKVQRWTITKLRDNFWAVNIP